MLSTIYGENKLLILLGVLGAFALSWLGTKFGQNSLPRDGGRKFAVNGALSERVGYVG